MRTFVTHLCAYLACQAIATASFASENFDFNALLKPDKETFYCVSIGGLRVQDFNENLPLAAREITEEVHRWQGDGSGFKLTLFNRDPLAEMEVKMKKGNEVRQMKLDGLITFRNSSHINVVFDYNDSYERGIFDSKASPTTASVIVDENDDTFLRSILVKGPINFILLDGGKCNAM